MPAVTWSTLGLPEMLRDFDEYSMNSLMDKPIQNKVWVAMSYLLVSIRV